MEGDKSPTIKQIKEKVNNILGYIPDNFTKYMIQMMTRILIAQNRPRNPRPIPALTMQWKFRMTSR